MLDELQVRGCIRNGDIYKLQCTLDSARSTPAKKFYWSTIPSTMDTLVSTESAQPVVPSQHELIFTDVEGS